MVLNCSSVYYLFSFVVVSLLSASRLVIGQILEWVGDVSLALKRHLTAADHRSVLTVFSHTKVRKFRAVNAVAVCGPRNRILSHLCKILLRSCSFFFHRLIWALGCFTHTFNA